MLPTLLALTETRQSRSCALMRIYGGYLYQRDGGVNLPTSGQAVFTGTDNYSSLSDFDGRWGLECVKGDMRVETDFDGFSDGAGVRGEVTNRQAYNIDDITNAPTLAEPDYRTHTMSSEAKTLAPNAKGG